MYGHTVCRDLTQWWNKPLRVLQFNIEDPYGFYANKISADNIIALARKIHANTVIVFARDAWGRVFYNGSSLYPKHPNTRLDVRELVEKGEKEGIHVVVMAAHTANRYLYRMHPDWAQRNKKGEVIVLEHYPRAEKVVDPHWPLICPNSPALDLYFVPEVEEAVRLTGAHGLLLDSFRYLPDPPRACFCQHCKLKFRREYGMDLPEEANIEDIAFRDAWEWRYNVTVRAIARMREAVKRANPDTLFFYNSHPAGWAGRGNIVVAKSRRYLDAVFAEASEVDVRGPGMLTIATKLSKAVLGDGKPVFVSRNAFYDLRPVQSPPAPTIRLGIYEIVASGGYPIVTMFSSQFFNDQRAISAVEEAYSVIEKIEEYIDGAEPLRYLGIVFDPETHDKYYWRKPEYYIGEVEGFSLIGMHRHIPWEIVSSTDLTEKSIVERYPIIIIPDMAILEDDAVDILENYVYNGGLLIITHEFGVMRPDYTYRESLAMQEILGLQYEGIFWFGYSYLHLGDDKIYKEYWQGLPRAVPFGDHSAAFAKERTDPKLGEVVRVTPVAEDVKVLGWTRLGRSAYGYEYTLGRSTPAPDSVTHLAALTLRKYGRGTVVYYAHMIGAHYSRLGHPDYADLVTRVIEKHGPSQPIKIKAPETVQAEVYRQGDRIIIHLVNHTFNQKILSAPTGPSKQSLPSFEPGYRVHPVREVIPVYSIEICIEKTVLNHNSARSFDPVNDTKLEITDRDQYICIKIPELKEYSVIVIEQNR